MTTCVGVRHEQGTARLWYTTEGRPVVRYPGQSDYSGPTDGTPAATVRCERACLAHADGIGGPESWGPWGEWELSSGTLSWGP